jgi:hypothetical protein
MLWLATTPSMGTQWITILHTDIYPSWSKKMVPLFRNKMKIVKDRCYILWKQLLHTNLLYHNQTRETCSLMLIQLIWKVANGWLFFIIDWCLALALFLPMERDQMRVVKRICTYLWNSQLWPHMLPSTPTDAYPVSHNGTRVSVQNHRT